MSTGEWQEHDEPEIGARLLVLCREVRFDGGQGDSPYSLDGLLSVLKPRGEFPQVWHEPVYLFVEFIGDAGEFEIWFDLIRYVVGEDGEIADEVDEGDEGCYGPFELRLPPATFVQGRSYPLKKLPIPAPGVYEVQLRIAGKYDVLASTRFLVEE